MYNWNNYSKWKWFSYLPSNEPWEYDASFVTDDHTSPGPAMEQSIDQTDFGCIQQKLFHHLAHGSPGWAPGGPHGSRSPSVWTSNNQTRWTPEAQVIMVGGDTQFMFHNDYQLILGGIIFMISCYSINDIPYCVDWVRIEFNSKPTVLLKIPIIINELGLKNCGGVGTLWKPDGNIPVFTVFDHPIQTKTYWTLECYTVIHFVTHCFTTNGNLTPN